MAASAVPDITGMLAKNTCTACHAMDRKLLGPSFKEVADKYAAKPDAVAYLAQRIKNGGSGVWGQVPMPSQGISPQDAQTLAQWIAQGAKRP
jgi:cytochrome c